MSALERAENIIGSEIEAEIPLDSNYDVSSILVTNKDVVKKTLGQLNILQTYHATITRIRRSGINISPTPTTKLQFGDKLIVVST